MPAVGRFSSFSEFLDAFEADRRNLAQAAEVGLSLASRRARRCRRPERDIAEVSARARVREPNDQEGGRYIRMRGDMTDVIETHPDVDPGVQRCLTGNEGVCGALRIGDRMGILALPTESIEAGDAAHLGGDRIPRAQGQDPRWRADVGAALHPSRDRLHLHRVPVGDVPQLMP